MARRQLTTTGINPVFPVIILLLIVGGVVLLIGGRGSESSSRPDVVGTVTTTTTTTTTIPEPVSVTALEAGPGAENPPASYRIVYEVTEVDVTREEVVIVNRPYESLVTSENEEEMTSGTATSRTQLWTYLPDQAGWLGVQGEAHRAAADHRPMPAMPAMVALNLAREAGTGSYAGRECQLYVTGQSLSASVVTPPAEDETTELCIDDAGLVLYERWQTAGDTLIERTALEVVADVDTSGVAFDPEPLIPDADTYSEALGQRAAPATDAQLAALRTEIEPPEGYEFDSAAFRSGSGMSEVVRFYSSGVDLVELAEVMFEEQVQMAEGGAMPVTIDGFDDVWFAPSFRASGLRMRLSAVSYVEIRGTNPAQLVELLRTMNVTD